MVVCSGRSGNTIRTVRRPSVRPPVRSSVRPCNIPSLRPFTTDKLFPKSHHWHIEIVLPQSWTRAISVVVGGVCHAWLALLMINQILAARSKYPPAVRPPAHISVRSNAIRSSTIRLNPPDRSMPAQSPPAVRPPARTSVRSNAIRPTTISLNPPDRSTIK